MHACMTSITQLSDRGQITLPAEIRKAIGLKPGDTLVVRIEDGRVILDPAVVMPVEFYTDERIAASAREAAMSPDEIAVARRKWRR